MAVATEDKLDEVVMGREKSDDRVVPKGRRKAVPTGASRGGKAVTASECAGQLEMFLGTADSPKGAATKVERGEPLAASHAVPKPRAKTGTLLRPMTMEEVASPSNLALAFSNVAKNDGAPGPDRTSVAEVREHMGDVLDRLHRCLLDGSYRPGLIRRVWIPKPGGDKRGLGIPNVVDRIVQQAVLQVLSPQYEPTFHASSHGFRPGRSCHTAIAEACRHLEEGLEWVVDLDLSRFFDRVHHERLLAKLAERIQDRRLLTLIRQMLRAKVVMPDGVVVSTEEGTPQGGPLSPLLSNIVLDELDRELERRGHRFVRYADDCNIYVRSERAGHRVMASVTRFIESRLRLVVNADKSAVARPEERHFVGFRLVPKPEGKETSVLLSKRSRERIERRIHELTPRVWGQSMDGCIRKLNAYLLGWLGFFWIAGIRQVANLADAHVRRRLRAIQLKQWSRRRTMAKRLIRLGVAPKAAWEGVYRGHKSIWALSRAHAVERGLSNAYFAKLGLVSLEETWKARRTEHKLQSRGPTQLTLIPG
jgi:RNA-directed DNA polymerase